MVSKEGTTQGEQGFGEGDRTATTTGVKENVTPNNSSIKGFDDTNYAKNVVAGSKGYYVTAGVFSSESNAKRQISKLRGMNVDANYFKDPSNNMYYVFVMKFDEYSMAKSAKTSQLNGQYSGRLWIKVVQ